MLSNIAISLYRNSAWAIHLKWPEKPLSEPELLSIKQDENILGSQAVTLLIVTIYLNWWFILYFIIDTHLLIDPKKTHLSCSLHDENVFTNCYN